MSVEQKCKACGQSNPPESKFCNACGAAQASVTNSDGLLSPGLILRNTYEVGDVLGEGGMGVVYACRHINLGTKYALKVLDSKLARIDTLKKRFLSEARIQSRLNHPNIVRVLDVLDDVVLAIVMEYIDGRSLDFIIERYGNKMPIKSAAALTLVILDAIGTAHKEGVIHRDLKPANIMVLNNTAKDSPWQGARVMDFGIAKEMAAAENRTVTGAKMGTPRYMAPEQIENAREVDARTDLYAIGLCLYEMICGRSPFEEYREFELYKAQLMIAPDPMSKFRCNVPPELEAIVSKALRKKREDRFADAAEFQRAILRMGGFEDLGLQLRLTPVQSVAGVTHGLREKIEKAAVRRGGSDKKRILSSSGSGSSSAKADIASEERARSKSKAKEGGTSKETEEARSDAVLVSEKMRAVSVAAEKRLSASSASSASEKSPGPERVSLSSASEKSAKIRKSRLHAEESAVSKAKIRLNPSLPTVTNLPGRGRGSAFKAIFLMLLIVSLVLFGLWYRHKNDMALHTGAGTGTETPEDFALAVASEESEFVPRSAEVSGGMVAVPGGSHWISTRGERGDVALRQVKLAAFTIDRFEVSVYRYMQCVKAGKCPKATLLSGDLNAAMTGVGIGTAKAFCEWENKRLPTSAEWEAAARYGSDIDGIEGIDTTCASFHVASGNECKKMRRGDGPVSVFSMVEAGNRGHILHVLGNVSEWVSDGTEGKNLVKGCSYRCKLSETRISSGEYVSSNHGREDIGWRCVRPM